MSAVANGLEVAKPDFFEAGLVQPVHGAGRETSQHLELGLVDRDEHDAALGLVLEARSCPLRL